MPYVPAPGTTREAGPGVREASDPLWGAVQRVVLGTIIDDLLVLLVHLVCVLTIYRACTRRHRMFVIFPPPSSLRRVASPMLHACVSPRSQGSDGVSSTRYSLAKLLSRTFERELVRSGPQFCR